MKRSAPAVSLVCLLAAMPANAGVTFTAIGAPSFAPVDVHLFSAPIGTAADQNAEFAATQALLLPPPNHVPNATLGIGPGAPHAGPYDHELGAGVAANGFVDSSSFTVPQYSNGNGVYLVFMLVPGAGSPTGSSPDFASGPILPNPIFPLTVSGSTLTNGVVNDGLGQFGVPAINQVSGFETLDGHSHIPFFFVDNFDFASNPITGAYEYDITITDINGNGFQIDAAFDVPEPPTWMVTGIAALAMGVVVWRRRRLAQS